MAAGGAFHVHDPGAAIVDDADIQAPVRLQENRVPIIQQSPDELGRFRLEQRLAPGDLHERATEGADFPLDVVNFLHDPSSYAYRVSQYEQRRLHPASRMKAQGRPAWEDSPWMLKKISLTFKDTHSSQ